MARTGNPPLDTSQDGPDLVHALDRQRNSKFFLYMGAAAAFIGGAVALLMALG